MRIHTAAVVLLLMSLSLTGCVTLDRPGADILTTQQDELFCREFAAARVGPEGGLLRETALQAELKTCLEQRGWVVTR